MVYVQFEYSLRKKKVVIEGEVQDRTCQYISLLMEINKRWYPERLVDWLMRVFKYEGEEIGTAAAIVGITVLAEIISHFWFNLSPQQNTFTHILLSLSLFLAFTVNTLTPQSYRLYAAFILSIVLSLAYGMMQLNQLIDYNITLILLITSFGCLLINTYKVLMTKSQTLFNSGQDEVEDSQLIVRWYEMETGYLVFLLIVGKVLQFYYSNLFKNLNNNQTFSITPYYFIPLIIALTALNSLKLWHFFQFNAYYIVSLLTTIHSEKSDELQRLSYFENFLIFGSHLSSGFKLTGEVVLGGYFNGNQLGTNNILRDIIMPPSTFVSGISHQDNGIQQSVHSNLSINFRQSLANNLRVNSGIQPIDVNNSGWNSPKINGGQQSGTNIFRPFAFQSQFPSEMQFQRQHLQLQQGDNKQLKSEEQPLQPYSSWIWLCLAMNVIHLIVLIPLIIYEKYGVSQLAIMSLGLGKPLVMMIYCQHYSVLISQSQRHPFYHLQYLLSDIFLTVPMLVGVFLLYFNIIILDSSYDIITILIHAYMPFLTKTIYRQLAKQSNTSMSNKSMTHFYIVFIVLLEYRQTLVVILSQSFPFIYILIDITLCVYAFFVIFIMSKLSFYKEVISQVSKILKMKNYKFYISEGMKQWQFDATQTSQSFYWLNISLLFLGYVIIKYQKDPQVNEYQVDYMIVMMFGGVIHLLNSYNSFYKYKMTGNLGWWYNTWWNYGVMLCGIAGYGLFAFLTHNEEYKQHKQHSLIALICALFVTFVRAFTHQFSTTFSHFYCPFKLINLLIAYILFYIPFMTLFIIIYFNLNLQKQYIFYFAVGGFAYLTLACVGIGIFVHAILNLTEKSKRTMFVDHKMNELFKQLRIKNDSEFLSTLENYYDIVNGNQQQLIELLKQQKLYKLIHCISNTNTEFTYQFIEVDQKQGQHHHENIKVVTDEQNDSEDKSEDNVSSRNSIKVTSCNKLSSLKNNKLLMSNKKFSMKNINSPESQVNFIELQKCGDSLINVNGQAKRKQMKEVNEFIKRYQNKREKMTSKKQQTSKILQFQEITKRIRENEQESEKIEEIIFATEDNNQVVKSNKDINSEIDNEPCSLYIIIVHRFLSIINDYSQIPEDRLLLQSIKPTLSNILSILTKLFDFGYIYIYGSVYTLYSYWIEDYSNNKWIFSFINYHIIFIVALVCVFIYVILIAYHKDEIVGGTLGLDQNQHAVSFTNVRYYTTFILFLMGSSLSNVFIFTTLNSYMCDPNTQSLWNFPQDSCYSNLHYVEMFLSLLILLSYYPLASLIFPFSSSIDRSLQIKYKSEFEIVYLQCKFLVNGINVIFNQLDFQTEQLIKSSVKTLLLIILTVLFYKLKPCSVNFINKLQKKVYIGMVIVNGAGVLCYFVGVKITFIVTGIVMGIYLVIVCVKLVVMNKSQVENSFPIQIIGVNNQVIVENEHNGNCIQSMEIRSSESVIKLQDRNFANDNCDIVIIESEQENQSSVNDNTITKPAIRRQSPNPIRPNPIKLTTSITKRRFKSQIATIRIHNRSKWPTMNENYRSQFNHINIIDHNNNNGNQKTGIIYKTNKQLRARNDKKSTEFAVVQDLSSAHNDSKQLHLFDVLKQMISDKKNRSVSQQ